MTVLVAADQNIPHLEELCDGWATLRTFDGRNVDVNSIVDSDALLVRSVTTVNQLLLESSRIRFVGSATIGCDHIDLNYLKRQKIQFDHAPGCNANAVVDYVMSVLLSRFNDRQLANITVGVAGLGSVGSRLVSCLQHFDISHAVYDPLLDDEMIASNCAKTRLSVCRDFAELKHCGVISFHVPLTVKGPFPTFHMANEQWLRNLATDAVLINSSRGEVIDNKALKTIIKTRADLRVALDVWESEPGIDSELFRSVDIATPHIAGHSSAGKYRGAKTVVDAMKRYFLIPQTKNTIAPHNYRHLDPSFNLNQFSKLSEFRFALANIYQVKEDDKAFRALVDNTLDKEQKVELGKLFDQFRRTYPGRKEIDYSIQTKQAHDHSLQKS